MNLRIFLGAIVACLRMVPVQSAYIDHNKVKPFAEPDPVTISEKAAVKFKPLLNIAEGCHSYPAVDEDGSVGNGLRWNVVRPEGGCKGSRLGSQVYARSTWHDGVWAIMYAWYFPRGREVVSAHPFARMFGHRHNWEYAIVWIDNPALETPSILGVSMSAAVGHSKKSPPDAKYLDGTRLKVEYYNDLVTSSTALRLTEVIGESQDLITWDQLPEEARNALIVANWDTSPFNLIGATFPLEDDAFNKTLSRANPL